MEFELFWTMGVKHFMTGGSFGLQGYQKQKKSLHEKRLINKEKWRQIGNKFVIDGH